MSDDRPLLERLQEVTGASPEVATALLGFTNNNLERAAEINPLDAETWSQLAHNRKHAGDAAGAAAAFERVVSLSHGRDFAALCSLAAVRTSMGDDAAALGHLERALAIGAPPSPAAAADIRDFCASRARIASLVDPGGRPRGRRSPPSPRSSRRTRRRRSSRCTSGRRATCTSGVLWGGVAGLTS